MFRTVPLSIIRHFSLYTQQWYMSYRFADSLRAGSGQNVLIRLFSLYTQQWCMSYRFADSLRAFFTVHTDGTFWSCSQAVSKPVWRIPLLCVQWKTPDDGQRNWSKHVEFHSQNKFQKLVRLVGFTIRIYHDARSPERQILIGLDIALTQPPHSFIIHGMINVIKFIKLKLRSKHQTFSCKLLFSFTFRQ
jgi:hypothetical protein